ncbi:MAG TPA: hypothetical protein VHW00_24640 [Thermoanaerobaculia bacterium]|nr:hypothetical protein [Thermoanaerobaculia bacterium]
MSVSFLATAAWGLIVLFAFIGWGGALAALLFRTRAVDAGLRAVWGISLALFLGGLACALHIATFTIYAYLIIGVVLAIAFFVRDRAALRPDFQTLGMRWRNHPGTSLLLVLCVVAVSIQYLASIWNIEFNPNDDFVAYFAFAKQILQQGTLFDPFSTRRAMSFGGQSFLHALVLAGVPSFRLHLFDQGLCLIVAALLLRGDRREPRWPWLVAFLVLVTLPDIRVNTYPQMAGTVLFYGAYRTLRFAEEDRPLANAAIIALVAGAACTLRSNFIAVAVPMLAISYALLFFNGSRARVLREAACTAAFGFLFLLPWMLLSYQSSGTPLFPLIQGNFNNAFPMLQAPSNWQQQVRDFIGTLRGNRLLAPFPILFLAGLLFPDPHPRKPLRSLLLASLVGWIALVHTLASDIPSFARYVEGFMVASGLAVITSITLPTNIVRRALAYAAIAAAALQLGLVGFDAIDTYANLVRKLRIVAPLEIRAFAATPVAEHYRALQARVPEGKAMLVQVDHPFLFDFKRNPIYNTDTAAAVSPHRGFPYFQGPAAVGTYLRAQSIDHLAFVKPDRARALFNRAVWERQKIEPHFLWRAQAPYYLDIFDNFEALSRSHAKTYEDDFLVLVDLSR